jgi:hypothetical protein
LISSEYGPFYTLAFVSVVARAIVVLKFVSLIREVREVEQATSGRIIYRLIQLGPFAGAMFSRVSRFRMRK